MKRVYFVLMAVLAAMLGVSGCLPEPEEDLNPLTNPDFIGFYNFTLDDHGFEGYHTGFTPDAADTLNLIAERLPTPSSNLPDSAWVLSARNPQEDLFMFATQEVDGLKPNQAYNIIFEIDLAARNLRFGSDTVTATFVAHLKAGTLQNKPGVMEIDGVLRPNFSVGNFAASSGDLVMMGSIRTPSQFSTSSVLRGGNFTNVYQASSNAEGKVWLVIGVHSEVNVHQAYYLLQFAAYFKEA